MTKIMTAAEVLEEAVRICDEENADAKAKHRSAEEVDSPVSMAISASAGMAAIRIRDRIRALADGQKEFLRRFAMHVSKAQPQESKVSTLRSSCASMDSLQPVSTDTENESAKIVDLKRQFAAEREHVKLLQKQLDAIFQFESSKKQGHASRS